MKLPPIVCISDSDWNYQWQRNHALMSSFANRGVPVLFVENMGGRSPGLKDWARIRQRAQRLTCQFFRGEQRVGNVTVLSLAVLPFQSGWARWINRAIFKSLILKKVENWLGSVTNPIVWTYSPSFLGIELAKALKPSFWIYDPPFVLKTHPQASQRLIDTEAALCNRVDVILVAAKATCDVYKKINPNTYLVTHGVDFELFAQAENCFEPAEIRGCKRPRLGFFGTLGWWVDYDLLRCFAIEHPTWTIVLIGPSKVSLSSLMTIPNIILLGAKEHAELPAYLNAMDVLCIPYLVDKFTDGVLPAKTYETLASGKPVVSTPIAEMAALQDVIYVADQHTFGQAVESALANDSVGLKQQRLEVARQNSWESRVDMLIEMLQDGLEKKAIR